MINKNLENSFKKINEILRYLCKIISKVGVFSNFFYIFFNYEKN